MAYKIGTKTFPKNAEGILRHQALRPIMVKVAKAEFAGENIDFLEAIKKNGKIKDIYDKFIDSNGSDALNLPSGIRKPMVDLAAANDWNPAAWRKHLSTAIRSVYELLDTNFIHKVADTKEFRQFCFQQAGTPQAAAKLIGIKNTKALGDILMKRHIGISKGDIIKDLEALRIKDKAKGVGTQMYLALQRKGFIA